MAPGAQGAGKSSSWGCEAAGWWWCQLRNWTAPGCCCCLACIGADADAALASGAPEAGLAPVALAWGRLLGAEDAAGGCCCCCRSTLTTAPVEVPLMGATAAGGWCITLGPEE